jgi:uncharacterized membrane protein
MESYAFWKTAHIISAAVLFGTGLGIAFFAWYGYRRALQFGQIDGLRMVLRLTVIADFCFTAPAVVFQLVSGVALMRLDGWSFVSPWALTVGGLFTAVGVCWLPVVAIQMALSREAEGAASISALSAVFHRRFQAWFVLGVPAFLLVIALFYLMVARPLATLG